jgi:hypothetical protein
MRNINRREILQTAALAAAFATAADSNANALRGLSERLVMFHWENNCARAVKALNLMRDKLWTWLLVQPRLISITV